MIKVLKLRGPKIEPWVTLLMILIYELKIYRFLLSVTL